MHSLPLRYMLFNSIEHIYNMLNTSICFDSSTEYIVPVLEYSNVYIDFLLYLKFNGSMNKFKWYKIQ